MGAVTPATASLRVASYNTRDFLDDRSAAARVVRAIAPDVLCLQEVPRRLGASRQVARFASECGLQWIGGHRGSGGTTIFLAPHVGLVEGRHRRLPVKWRDRTRGYAVAHLDLPGWPPLTVASIHLGLRDHERERHARRIVATILGGRDPGHEPGLAIVAGDLNESDDGPAHAQFLGALARVSSPHPSYPAWRPTAVIDVVFASSRLHAVAGSPVVLSEDDVLAASDHRPVWVDLSLRPTVQ